jgi:hypothetical protein
VALRPATGRATRSALTNAEAALPAVLVRAESARDAESLPPLAALKTDREDDGDGGDESDAPAGVLVPGDARSAMTSRAASLSAALREEASQPHSSPPQAAPEAEDDKEGGSAEAAEEEAAAAEECSALRRAARAAPLAPPRDAEALASIASAELTSERREWGVMVHPGTAKLAPERRAWAAEEAIPARSPAASDEAASASLTACSASSLVDSEAAPPPGRAREASWTAVAALLQAATAAISGRIAVSPGDATSHWVRRLCQPKSAGARRPTSARLLALTMPWKGGRAVRDAASLTRDSGSESEDASAPRRSDPVRDARRAAWGNGRAASRAREALAVAESHSTAPERERPTESD